VYEGMALPRLQHWDRADASAYRSAFALCERIGLRDLAIQLHVRRSADTVATAVLDGFDASVWRAAHQGCADGLLWDSNADSVA
jgi:hypothetical protein